MQRRIHAWFFTVASLVVFTSAGADGVLRDEAPHFLWADEWHGHMQVEIDSRMQAPMGDMRSSLRGSAPTRLSFRSARSSAVEWRVRDSKLSFSFESSHDNPGWGTRTRVEDGLVPLLRGSLLIDPVSWHAIIEWEVYRGADGTYTHIHKSSRGHRTEEQTIEVVPPVGNSTGRVAASAPVPHAIGPLTGEVRQRVMGGVEVHRWELAPTHQVDRWQAEYHALLVAARETYLAMWYGINARCRSGEIPAGNPLCRSATLALARYEGWLDRLAADCGRIIRTLLGAGAPGFLSAMEQHSGYLERAVIEGAPRTCDVIHRHLWEQIPPMPGSARSVYDRLPEHLQMIYSPSQFEQVTDMRR